MYNNNNNIIFGVSTDSELRLELCLRVLYYYYVTLRLRVADGYQIFIIYNIRTRYTRQSVLCIYKVVGLDEKPVCVVIHRRVVSST